MKEAIVKHYISKTGISHFLEKNLTKNQKLFVHILLMSVISFNISLLISGGALFNFIVLLFIGLSGYSYSLLEESFDSSAYVSDEAIESLILLGYDKLNSNLQFLKKQGHGRIHRATIRKLFLAIRLRQVNIVKLGQNLLGDPVIHPDYMREHVDLVEKNLKKLDQSLTGVMSDSPVAMLNNLSMIKSELDFFKVTSLNTSFEYDITEIDKIIMQADVGASFFQNEDYFRITPDAAKLLRTHFSNIKDILKDQSNNDSIESIARQKIIHIETKALYLESDIVRNLGVKFI